MNQPGFGEFCWNELATTDIKAAKKFYGELLGWTFVDHDMGEMTYTMIKSKEGEFGGMWHIPTEQKNDIPPHWMGYILVDNAEATLAQAVKLGAEVKMPVTKVGEMGQFLIVKDPTGAHIAFWESLTTQCPGN